MRAWATHGWGLQVDGAFRVQDEVEEVAVGVVALELDLERRGEVQRLGSGDKSRLNIIGLLGHGQGADALQLLAHAILVLDLLLVIIDQGFLLDVAVVLHGADWPLAVLEGAHGGGIGFS